MLQRVLVNRVPGNNVHLYVALHLLSSKHLHLNISRRETNINAPAV